MKYITEAAFARMYLIEASMKQTLPNLVSRPHGRARPEVRSLQRLEKGELKSERLGTRERLVGGTPVRVRAHEKGSQRKAARNPMRIEEPPDGLVRYSGVFAVSGSQSSSSS